MTTIDKHAMLTSQDNIMLVNEMLSEGVTNRNSNIYSGHLKYPIKRQRNALLDILAEKQIHTVRIQLEYIMLKAIYTVFVGR